MRASRLIPSVVFAFAVFAAGALVDAADELEYIDCPARTAAYDVAQPSRQKGYFPAGARLEVVEHRTDGMIQVRFLSRSGQLVEALCWATDFGLPGADPRETLFGTVEVADEEEIGSPQGYQSKKWLKDKRGFDRALELQGETKAPILFFICQDNCERSRMVQRGLFKKKEFKEAAMGVIKVEINTGHGAEEWKLGEDLGVQGSPTILVQDALGKRPRRISLISRMGSRLAADSVEGAMAKILMK